MNMYRFRSLKNLLKKHQELEKQEIRFSTLEELNDPMEGFMKIYWEGDDIAWIGLLKHYLLCLEKSFSLYRLDAPKESLDNIDVFRNESTLPTPKYREIFNDLKNEFFSRKIIQELIHVLSNDGRKVSKAELRFLLESVHQVAFESVVKTHYKNGTLTDEEKQIASVLLPQHEENFMKILSIYRKIQENPVSQDIMEVFPILINETFLLGMYRNRDKICEQRKKYMSVSVNFASRYLKKIEQLIFPESYVVCFASEPTSSLMWSHYTEGHRGVCLKFKTGDENTIGLKNPETDTNALHLKFNKIDYDGEHPTIIFFRDFGRVTRKDVDFWLKDDGKTSKCYEPFLDEEKFRNDYWKKYPEVYTVKTTDWRYENEYRLHITDFYGDPRRAKYDFSDLEGIIFGVRTPTENKLEIIEIISVKCKKEARTDFKFYQSEYSSDNRKMIIAELFLLNREITEEVKTLTTGERI